MYEAVELSGLVAGDGGAIRLVEGRSGREMPASRLGVLYALVASLASSASCALVKYSILPVGQTTFLTGIALLLVGLLVAYSRSQNVFPRGRRLRISIFSLLSAFVLLSDYEALRLMPLADEVVVSYTSVAFTVILARIFLKEKCGGGKLSSTLLILAGVVLISELGTIGDSSSAAYPSYGLGCFLTLFGAFFDGTTYIFIKGLADLHVAVILTNCGWAAVLLSGPMSLIESWTLPNQPLVLIAIIFLAILQEVFLYLAVSAGEEAGLVSLVQASDIVFSYIWELCFFTEKESGLRFLGAGLVSAGVCLAAITSTDQEDSSAYSPLNQDKDPEEDLLEEPRQSDTSLTVKTRIK